MVRQKKYTFDRGELRKAREAAKLSQQELADRAKVSLSLIGFLEQGQRTDPKMSTVAKLARALGVSIERLIAED